MEGKPHHDWATLDPRIDALREQGLPRLEIARRLGIPREALRARLDARALAAPASQNPYTDEQMRRGERARAKEIQRRFPYRRQRRPGLKALIRQWRKDHRGLPRQQRDLVQALEASYTHLKRTYHGAGKPIDQARVQADYQQHERLIRRMIRGGLDDHPIVRELRPFLHYPGRGRPFKPPSADDRALIAAVTPLLAQGLTLSAVHRHLQATHTYTASRAALDKRLRRLRLWPVR
jgi:hypothetical protein